MQFLKRHCLFVFLEWWKILYTVKYGSAPSFQIMHYKMKKDCPVSDKLKPTNKPSRGIYYKEKDLADIKPDKHIIGRITISTAKSPKLLFLQPTLLGSWVTVTSYKFQIDTVLRLNVTILHLE